MNGLELREQNSNHQISLSGPVSPGFTLCPIQVSIENHTLVLIASDTNSIEPIRVDSFIIHAGER